MTTVIACRPLLTMVADSRISHGDSKFTSSKKIQKVGRYLAGVAGDYAPALSYLKEFAASTLGMDGKAIPKMPAFGGEFELMILSEFGLWIYGDDGTPIEVEERSTALAQEVALQVPASVPRSLQAMAWTWRWPGLGDGAGDRL